MGSYDKMPGCATCGKSRGDHYTYAGGITYCDPCGDPQTVDLTRRRYVVKRLPRLISDMCATCGKDWGRHFNGDDCDYPKTTRTFQPFNPPLVGPQLTGDTQVPATLQITDDKVRAAAAQCPDAKRILTTLFPTVFVDPTFDDAGRVRMPASVYASGGIYSNKILHPVLGTIVERRDGGNLSGVGLFLSNQVDWAIEHDSTGWSVLVAYKKGR